MNISDAKKSLSLFFFFSLLDDQLALSAASQCSKKKFLNEDSSEDGEVPISTLVYLTNKVWLKHKNKKMFQSSRSLAESGWVLPESVDIGLWRQFVKEAESEEYLTLIWSKILNYKDSDIAEGLGVTVGTVRHRVGRALRSLGIIRAKNQL